MNMNYILYQTGQRVSATGVGAVVRRQSSSASRKAAAAALGVGPVRGSKQRESLDLEVAYQELNQVMDGLRLHSPLSE